MVLVVDCHDAVMFPKESHKKDCWQLSRKRLSWEFCDESKQYLDGFMGV